MSAFKAQAHIRELKQRLQLTMPSATITEAMDADGFSSLKIVNSTEVFLCKVITDGNAGRVDGLGLPQRSYSPHIAQALQDSDQTSAASKALKARMSAALAKLGMKMIIKEDTKANLAAATAATFDAAYAAAPATVITMGSDEINPLIQSQ
jgi:hypothetical protein